MPNRTPRATAFALLTGIALLTLTACGSDTTTAAPPSDPQYAAVRDATALRIQEAVDKAPDVAGSHVLDGHQAAGKDTVSVLLLVRGADTARATEIVNDVLTRTWQTLDHLPAGVNVQIFDTKTQSNLDVAAALRSLNLAAESGPQSSATVDASTLVNRLGAVPGAAAAAN